MRALPSCTSANHTQDDGGFGTVGGRMRIARENNNLTIAEAAIQLNTLHGVLKKIERNDRTPTARLILNAANLYNASAKWIFNGDQQTG